MRTQKGVDRPVADDDECVGRVKAEPSAKIKIMRNKHRFDVFQAVASDGRDFASAASGKGETRNCCST